ncbi:Sjogren's syndrome/scleroderma autoantigen 1 family protein [Haloferax sp. DFSO52]|uniref:Sjogren's syndrome/scleroderma autoantigen 1 family protein n=1 Tax=Haloferax sp. DFSO52 TaxID=3388505 RepID=UPI003A8840ED
MSEFDKEAERQKLREKYERDEQKRQSTQRMSELLLKGATMTNKHCDQCGDPIFRYDGQEFCPTCQTQGQVAVSADADAENAAEAVAQAEATPEPKQAAADDQHVVDDTQRVNADTSTQSSENGQSTDERRASSAVESNVAKEISTGNQTQSGEVDDQRSSARQTQSGDISSARQSLVRTLNWAATQAESTDDPRRAREFLGAAREAAEALAALDR